MNNELNLASINAQELQLLQNDAVVVAVPFMSADRAIDLVLSSLFFLWSILHQIEVLKSIHVVGILCMMFAVYAAISAVNDQLTQIAATNALNRVTIARALLRIFYIVLAYLSGLFVRIISDPIINGPHVGGFGFIDLLWPLTVICVAIVFFAQIRMSTEHRAAIVAALQNEHLSVMADIQKLKSTGGGSGSSKQ